MDKTNIKLYFIRHAESFINIDSYLVSGRSNESPLTPQGIAQSRRLGQHLRERSVQPTRIYSSPAVRAVQTASHALGAMKLRSRPIIDDALQELDQGDWVGRLRTDIYSEATLANIRRERKDFKAPNGESMNEVGARMLEWLNKVAADVRPGHAEQIFAFTHGVAISCLASSIYGWSHSKTYKVAVDNVSISLFEYQNSRWRLTYFAVRPDLLF